MKKLLFDGEGTGEDRQLNNLIKKITTWATTNNSTPCEYEKILRYIKAVELTKTRSELVRERVINEIELTTNCHEKLVNSNETLRREIIANKDSLIVAKAENQIKMQYDMMARQINQYKSRQEYNSQVQLLTSEIEEMRKEMEEVERKTKSYRNYCKTISASANSINEMLESDARI